MLNREGGCPYMGTSLISLYKSKLKREHKIAFYSAFLLCLLVHIYKFTNNLPNHDSWFNTYTDQNMTISGRWFLSLACGISSYFDLPWINGLLSALYLSLTMVVIVSLFEIRNPVVIILSSFLLVSFPSATETFFFLFTADGYFIAMLLSAFAAYLSCKGSRWYSFVLSGVCLCLSCAIYQAYVSFAIFLVLFYSIAQLLDGNLRGKELKQHLCAQIIIFISAMISYYVIWRVVLLVTGQVATDYQGISSVGSISLQSFLYAIFLSVKNLIHFFCEWNFLRSSITLYAALNIVFLLVFFAGLGWVLWKQRKKRTAGQTVLLLLCLALCLPCASLWCFASNAVQYRPMMLYSICILYIFAVIFFDKYFASRYSTIFGTFILIIAVNFSLIANISYFYMDRSYEQSYSTGVQMVSQIHALPNIEDANDIAIIGSVASNATLGDSGPSAKIHLLATGLEDDMLFDHTHTYLFLKEVFGLSFVEASPERRSELEDNSVVAQMGIWPSSDSVQIIDGTIVIKLSDSTTP